MSLVRQQSWSKMSRNYYKKWVIKTGQPRMVTNDQTTLLHVSDKDVEMIIGWEYTEVLTPLCALGCAVYKCNS